MIENPLFRKESRSSVSVLRHFGRRWLLILLAVVAVMLPAGSAVAALITADLSVPRSDAPHLTVTEGEDLVFTISAYRSPAFTHIDVTLEVVDPSGYVSAESLNYRIGGSGAYTNQWQTFRVPTLNDKLVRPDGQVTIRLISGPGYQLDQRLINRRNSQPQITFTVRNNDLAAGPVQNLRAKRGHEKLTLSWETPTSLPTTNAVAIMIKGYEVRYADTTKTEISDATWTSVAAGSTQHEVTQLKAGKTLLFQVRAIDVRDIPGAVTPLSTGPLQAPNVTAHLVDDTPVAEGQPIRYRLEKYLLDDEDAPLEVHLEFEDPSGRLAPTTPNKVTLDEWATPTRNRSMRQEFEFATVNDTVFNSQTSIRVLVKLDSAYLSIGTFPRAAELKDDEVLPGPPTNLGLEVDGVEALEFSWEAPADLGKINDKSVTSTEYDVRFGESSAKFGEWHEIPAGFQSLTVTQLSAHRDYTFEVRARTPAGTGPLASVKGTSANHAPDVTFTTASSTINSGESFSLEAKGTDSDQDTLTYTWAIDPPGTGTFTTTDAATSSWTAPRVRVPTVVTLRVKVNDGSQSAQAEKQITINPAAVGVSIVSNSGATSGAEGDSSVHRIEFAVAYSKSGLSYAEATPVSILVTGPDVDFASKPTTVTLPANTQQATFAVEYRGNTDDNPDRTITVAVQPGEWYAPSPTSASVTYTITDDDVPSAAPTGLRAAGGYRQVTLSWGPPADKGQLDGAAADVTGYEYQWVETGGNLERAEWIAIADSANATRYVVTGLLLNRHYTFALRARTEIGVSPATTPLMVSTQEKLPVVSVQNVLATPTLTEGGTIHVRLSLSPVVADVGGLTTTIRVNDALGRLGEIPPRMLTIPGGETSVDLQIATAANRIVDGSAAIQVVLRTATGYTIDSKATMVIFTVEDDESYPDAPGAVMGTAGYQQVALSWEAPTDTGTLDGTATPITGYDYRDSQDSTRLAAAPWHAIPNSASTTSYVVTGLNMNTEHTFQVRARNSLGYGTFSDPLTKKTYTGMTLSLTTDGATTAAEGSEFRVKVTITPAPPDTDLNVSLQVIDPGAHTDNVSELSGKIAAGSKEIVLTLQTSNDRIDNIRDDITVRALPAARYAVAPAASEVVFTATDDDALPPQPVATATAGYRQVTLTWTPTTNTGKVNGAATAILGYDYRLAAPDDAIGNASWISIPNSANATRHVVTGLNLETTYEMEFRARNTLGPSPAISLSATTQIPEISIVQKDDITVVTEGQTENVPSFLIKVSPFAVEEDLPFVLNLSDPGAFVGFTIPTQSVMPKGASEVSQEFVTRQNTLINTEDQTRLSILPLTGGYIVSKTDNLITYTINEDDALPEQVTQLTAQSEIKRLEYTWQPPASTGLRNGAVAPILYYEVRHADQREDLPSRPWEIVEGDGAARSYELVGLGNNEAVLLQIRAVNVIGPGPLVTIDANSVLNNPPTVKSDDRSGVSGGGLYLFATGTDPDPGDGLIYEFSGEGTWGPHPNGFPHARLWTAPLVSQDTDYVLTVTVRDRHGLTASDTMTVAITPLVVSIRAVSESTEVAERSSDDTTRVKFLLSISPLPSQQIVANLAEVPQTGLDLDGSGGAKTVTFPKLSSTKQEVEYRFKGNSEENPNRQLTVRLSSGTGYAVSTSESVASYTVVNDDEVSEMVRNFEAEAYNKRVSLSWETPADTGKLNGTVTPIIRYEYRYAAATGTLPQGEAVGDWKTIPGGATASSHDLTGLQNGRTYDIEIRPVNVVGIGPTASDSSSPFNSAPTVSISAPAKVTTGGTIKLTAIYSDRDPDSSPRVQGWESPGEIPPPCLDGTFNRDEKEPDSLSWTAPLLSEEVTCSFGVQVTDGMAITEVVHQVTVKVPVLSIVRRHPLAAHTIPGRPDALREGPFQAGYQNTNSFIPIVVTTGEGATADDLEGTPGTVPAVDLKVYFDVDDPGGWIYGSRFWDENGEPVNPYSTDIPPAHWHSRAYYIADYALVTHMDIHKGNSRTGLNPQGDANQVYSRNRGFPIQGDNFLNEESLVTISLKPSLGYRVNERQKTIRVVIVSDDFPPTTPTDFSASHGRFRADISWEEPSSFGIVNGIGQSDYIYFTYEYRHALSESSIDDVAWTEIGGTSETVPLENLQEGVPYRFQLRGKRVTLIGEPATFEFTVPKPEIGIQVVGTSSVVEGTRVTFEIGAIDPVGLIARKPQTALSVTFDLINEGVSPATTTPISVTIPAGGAGTRYRHATVANGVDNPDYKVIAQIQTHDGYQISEGLGRAEYMILDDEDPPGAPELTANPQRRQVTLSWEPPADSGQQNGQSTPITGYEVRWASSGNDINSATWAQVSGGATARKYIVSGLTNDALHAFQVRAVNAAGVSVPGPIETTPVNAAPTADAGEGTIATSGAKVQLEGEGSDPDIGDTVSFEWTSGQGAFSDATLKNPMWTAPIVSEVTDVVLTLAVTDLEGLATTDTLTVRVRPPVVSLFRLIDATLTDTMEGGSGDEGQVTAWVTTNVYVPLATTDGGTSSVGSGLAGISPAVDLTINLQIEGSTGVTLKNPPATALIQASGSDYVSFAIEFNGDGLANSDPTITVSLQSGTGYAVDTERNSVTFTLENDDVVPGPPTGLTATFAGEVADLNWIAPASSGQLDGGVTPLTGYETRHAKATESLADTWTLISGSGPTTTSHLVTGLTKETAYTFEVRARNIVGAGEADSVTAAPAIFSGDLTGEVTEDATEDTVNGTVMVDDSDGDDTMQAQTEAEGIYGSFMIETDGAWAYMLNNTKTETNVLAADVSVMDEFTIQAADGTQGKVVITVMGANDAATIGGDLSGAVVEDAEPDTVMGTVTVTDPDGEDKVQVPASLTGAYGMFTFDTAGVWTYALNNAHEDVDGLSAGATLTDELAIQAADGTPGKVVITVTGVNDAAVFAGVAGAVAEDAEPNIVRGTVTVTDPDGEDTVQVPTNLAGTYGTFTFNTVGVWTYALNNANEDVDGLTAGATLTDELSIQSADGTSGKVVITVTGMNDAAVFSGATGAVTEDAEPNTVRGTVTVKDSDGEDTVQVPTNLAGTYGTFTFTTVGVWTYALNNAHEDVDGLTAGATLTDELAIQSADGTAGKVVITVTGVNDAATIGGDLSGAVEEDAEPNTVRGTVTVTDPDGEDTVQVPTNLAGAYGTFTFTTVGVWTYALNNANEDVDGLTAGATLKDELSIQAADGTAGKVVITVTGVNDAAVFSGAAGAVTEDAEPNTVRGTVTVKDPDGEDTVQVPTNLAGAYGTFTFNTAGVWTYALNNANEKVDELAAGATLTDELAIQSADGTAGKVVVTVTGVNDAATIGGDLSGAVTEDAESNAVMGTVTVMDVDGENKVRVPASLAGAYGTFTFTTVGVWTYALNNANEDVDGLTAGATLTDELAIQSADGTPGKVVVTVTGANDAAVFAGTAGAVVEDAEPNTVRGTVTVKDPDGEDTAQVPTNLAGAYGTFTFNTVGVWTYALNNANEDVDGLTAGATLKDELAIQSADGTAGKVVITVTGANDAAVFAGAAGTVVEDAESNTVRGTVTVKDPDGEDTVQVPTNLVGTYGTFTFNTVGVWTYALNNAHEDVDGLTAGVTLTDELSIQSADGTAGKVVITVTGVNDAAVFSGVAGAVTEDAESNIVRGTVMVKDPDGEDKAQVPASLAGAYGTFTFTTAGVWTYALNNANEDVDGLTAGATLTDELSIQSADGTPGKVVITVTGTNDAAVFSGAAGAVTEDAEPNIVSGTVTVTDPDGEDKVQVPASLAGTYGTFTFNTVGVWTYALNNADEDVDGLTAGATLKDELSIQSADGTPGKVVITVTGVNDAAVFSGAAGAVTEDAEPNTVRGTVTVEDPDGENKVRVPASLTGAYGTFTFNTVGVWTYALNNAHADVDGLTAGATLKDELSIQSADGTPGKVVITVTGANDAAVFSGAAGAVVEDAEPNTVRGTVTVADPDGENTVQVPASLTGAYGTFTFNTVGVWTYALNNAHEDVDGLTAGATLTDELSIQSADGTPGKVVITVTGANDAAVFSGAAGAVVEDAEPNTVRGTVTVKDSDGEDKVQVPASLTGTYGTFTFNTVGVWTYALNNAHEDVDGLTAGATLTDELSIQSADGTPGKVVITVTGVNDAAVFSGATGAVTEDAEPNTVMGTVTVADPDGENKVRVPASLTGAYGTFTCGEGHGGGLDVCAEQCGRGC